MSGERRRQEAPQGPPWSLDLLADLHAGVLDETTAEELRREVAADPAARDILAALEATSTELAELPSLTIPDDVAARIDAALEDEVRAWSQEQTPPEPEPEPEPEPLPEPVPANVVNLASRRRRRLGWGAGVVAAAAAITGVFVLPPILNTDRDQQAAPPPGPPSSVPLALHSGASGDVALTPEQFGQVNDSEQYAGTLSDPVNLVACLQANGVHGGKPMGAREVTVDGQPAQVFILPGGGIGRFRLLAVGVECGPGNPATISDSSFGG